ncbi:tRNA pseudouridine(38-40) synthase TruA [Bacillus alkalicellulosilyticus]|uniref:tRNA pseudouridine(38-40) synthase TruA n=1 Tax=Alkalihalobacterium alkalicellulosilyticum TaxID=1912214 RepID=UPI000995F7B0|nr:tRNA pseudouridine(38-40) synthase TruA [Bacillus alkalicellulosilyticus]
MRRMKAVITYDGTNFCGFQSQPNLRTVQSEVEKALTRIHKGEEVIITASGRTDAGVHAHGQVFHFDTSLAISEEKWPFAFRGQLPLDIEIREITEVDRDFHARYDVEKKEYRYRVLCSRTRDVFSRQYQHYVPYQVDFERMVAGSKHLLGKHDFTSFCSTKTATSNRVRTIYELDIERDGNEFVFRIVGNGFLYNMVRIIVGTLLEVGRGKREPEDIKSILEAQNRKRAGKTAPGHGLYLWEVTYKDETAQLNAEKGRKN